MKRVCASASGIGFVLALLSVGATGCGAEAGAGSVRVFWVVAGSTCSDAGVASVRIFVEDSEGTSVVSRPIVQSCANGLEGVVVRDVPAGSWTVRIEGLDVEARTFLEGTRGDVQVGSGRETKVSPAIQLSLISSRVRLVWKFENGDLCSTNGVDWVEVNVFKGLEGQIDSKTWTCEPEVVHPDGGVILSDLPSNAELTFHVFGLTPTEVRTFKGAGKIQTVPGELQTLKLDLIACSQDWSCQ